MTLKKGHGISLIQKHIVGWLVYDLVMFFINFLATPAVRIQDVFALSLIYMLVFYVCLFFLKHYVDNGKHLMGSLAIILSFGVLSVVGYEYVVVLLPLAGVKILIGSFDFQSFLQAEILVYMRFFIFALLYFFVERSFRKEKQLRILLEEKFKIEQQRKQEELENAILKQQDLKSQKEKLQFEYAFLRSQINPHFLYNTLNVLFSQALCYSGELADNIMKLSHLMRYAIESIESEEGRVSIKNELQHLQTLIDIYQVRFENQLHINYQVLGEIGEQLVPPLSIITVVENGFKYGDLKDPANPLVIMVILQPKQIYFYCNNKKKATPSLDLSSHNIGFSNLNRRLDIGFKDMYEMKTHDQDAFYTFELTIKN
jgi:sensor histidine kinase YesM